MRCTTRNTLEQAGSRQTEQESGSKLKLKQVTGTGHMLELWSTADRISSDEFYTVPRYD